ncbi:MAG: zinc ABC transporter substrate-binding protein [Betaproteobacteria bacterium]|nr:MAG: zinc ABC transporter substrate-binding protein [Betaproteobacteria bacterium]
MTTFFKRLLLAALACIGLQAHAALNVVACEPEWASLAKELGGDKLNVSSATTALQDPHHIEARPSLIARVRGADLLVCTGMELEVGWLPVLIQQSGNARLAVGSPSLFEAGRFITPLEVPTRLDRSEGDVHAAGNPHIQQDPRNIAKIASALSARLAQIDAANAKTYQDRLQAFSARSSAAMQKWEQQARPLKGVAFVAHHKNMNYLADWLGMREVGTLEPKPGVEPSVGHLTELNNRLAQQPAKLVVRAAYEDPRASQWLSDRAHIPAVMLPFTVGGNASAGDLFGLFDSSVAILLDAAK